MSDDDIFPFPLAWHPRVSGDRPDPARFTVPTCGSDNIPFRTGGGLWTSPMIGARHSVWSIHADQENITGILTRQGWALAWPDPARTARVERLPDLQALVERYPCRAHRPLERQGMLCSQAFTDPAAQDLPYHDSRMAPPLDFAAMSADFDAIHLSEAGRKATWHTLPGTTMWSVETVLWLAPVWQLLHPVTTMFFTPDAFATALEEALASGTPW